MNMGKGFDPTDTGSGKFLRVWSLPTTVIGVKRVGPWKEIKVEWQASIFIKNGMDLTCTITVIQSLAFEMFQGTSGGFGPSSVAKPRSGKELVSMALGLKPTGGRGGCQCWALWLSVRLSTRGTWLRGNLRLWAYPSPMTTLTAFETQSSRDLWARKPWKCF